MQVSADSDAAGLKARQPSRPTLLLAVAIAAGVALPVVAVFFIAASGGDDIWGHILAYVLPRATETTLYLLVLTGMATAVFGVLTAWLVTGFDFPGRRLVSPALVLPLAIPSYLAAYAFGEFFDFTGPIQTWYRQVFGYQSARDYWFPQIRSLGGAVLILSSVLYPYVYLACRSIFAMQGRTAADVARTLGAGPYRVFFRVQLPMARPAVIIGLTLVMMEVLNDIGAVEFLGVNTMTFAVYSTWLNRGSLTGAAQIASAMLFLIAILILIERAARRRQRFTDNRTISAAGDATRHRLSGVKAFLAMLVCALPVLSGFALPVLVLGRFALARLEMFTDPRLVDALVNSLSVSAATAFFAVVLGFMLAYATRAERSGLAVAAGRAASLGYGLPGTVLAIGVLVPFAAIDNGVDGFLREQFGISTGLVLSGTGFAIVYACTVRFMVMAEGTLDAGMQKLSPHLDMAARTLGRNRRQTVWSVLLPNMRPALLTAALLVFIETMKELSATILLRPFSFNTLATLVYEDASRAKIEDSSVAAIIIIAAGLIPVLVVSRSLDKLR